MRQQSTLALSIVKGSGLLPSSHKASHTTPRLNNDAATVPITLQGQKASTMVKHVRPASFGHPVTVDHDVFHDAAAGQYSLTTPHGTSLTVYFEGNHVRTFIHTETPPQDERQGFASKLIAAAIADSNAEGFRVVGVCPFVAAYLRKHPEQNVAGLVERQHKADHNARS